MNNRIFVLFLIWVSPFLGTPIIHSQDTQYDGLPIIYVTQPRQNEFDFYAINPFTGETLFQRTSSRRNCPIKFSPDGEWFHYQQHIKPDYRPHNFARNMNTGEVTELDRLYEIYDWEYILWIPDTSEVVFSHDLYGVGKVYHYDFTTGKLRVLRDYIHHRIEVGISGGKLFYWYWDNFEITLENLEGDVYDIDDATYIDDVVSADNKYIALTIKPGLENVRYNLFIDLVTDEQFVIDDMLMRYDRSRFAWSPDSQSLIYVNTDGNFIIHDIFTEEKTILTSSYSEYILSSAWTPLLWSPNARYVVVYTSQDKSTYDNQHLLFVLDTTTGEETVIAQYNSRFIRPTFLQWINDEQFAYIKINFDANGILDRSDVFRFDMATGTEMQLTHTPHLIKLVSCEWG